jgi:hypothetical protein
MGDVMNLHLENIDITILFHQHYVTSHFCKPVKDFAGNKSDVLSCRYGSMNVHFLNNVMPARARGTCDRVGEVLRL